MKLGLLLIALGMGYRVYVDATKEKGNLRSLGQWVGAIMMAVSLVTSAMLIYVHFNYWTGKGPCPMMPYSFQGRMPAAVPPASK